MLGLISKDCKSQNSFAIFGKLIKKIEHIILKSI